MTEDFKRKLTAILSADVVGYSRLMGDDEAATVKTLETYKGVMSSLIKQHRGRVVDSPGDNLLAEFGSVVDAVQCAVSIQKEIQTRNADLSENRRMYYRIGINLGDVIEEEDRIYGDGVNIAARLEALADPGGICISKTAFDYIENKLPFGYSFIGEQTVKNIAKPIGAYKVLMETRLIDEEGQKAITPIWKRKMVLSFGVIVILAIVAVLYWKFYHLSTPIEPASVEQMAYPLPDKPSIAVLPFTNMSGDPEQDYIGDGLSENIISALSVSSEILVIARNSTFKYKGKAVDIKEVAEDFSVQYVLEGSVQKSGDQLRITAQLIDALSGHHLWSEVYDREMMELFDLLDEITKKIMVAFQVELSGSEEVRVYAKSTDNLEAWKHYIKGVDLFDNINMEDNLKAREHFEAAIEIDSTFVAALSMLARTHLVDYTLDWSSFPLTSMKQAIELAQKAVELDGHDPYAHAVLGMAFLYQRQHEKAIREAKLAIELNPNYSVGYVTLAYTMLYSGRFDEAIDLGKKAARLNSNIDLLIFHVLSVSYIFLDQYEEALKILRQWEKNVLPGSRSEVMVKVRFSWIYQELGREEEARAYIAEVLKINPDYSLDYWADDPHKDPANLHRMLDAFRKAGIPEKPPGSVQEKASIAVLPFDNLSSDPEQNYFVAGLSEEILNSLTQIPGLGVTARTSSFAFKGTDKTVPEIASILGVNHILEGSVRKSGNTLRITTQLIRSSDGLHLWSESYNRELKDVFRIQADIANNVADKLKLTLEAFNILGGTKNVDAYEFYLKAKGKRNEANVSGYKDALELLDAAIDLDPEFALAWAHKAENHLLLHLYSPPDESIKEENACIRAAQKAIELEPNLGDGYLNLSSIQYLKGEWIEAEINFKKALELLGESLSGEDHHIIPFYLTVGKPKRALELLERMYQNDPVNQVFHGWYYIVYGMLGDRNRIEKKFLQFNKSLENSSGVPLTIGRLSLGDALSREDIVSSDPIDNTLMEYLDSPKEGLLALHRIYDSDNNLSSHDLSVISSWAAYFGDPKLAMAVVEKASSINTGSVLHLWFPVAREVRQLPRFKEFVREISLVDYWKEYGWPDLCRPVGDDDFVCD